jgi:hypothetical protein
VNRGVKHCIAALGSNCTEATILPLTRNVQAVVCRAPDGAPRASQHQGCEPWTWTCRSSSHCSERS